MVIVVNMLKSLHVVIFVEDIATIFYEAKGIIGFWINCDFERIIALSKEVRMQVLKKLRCSISVSNEERQ